MDGPAPLLSVVMPNYNHCTLLELSVGAILAQTRMPDEILIVDDGSTDDSLAVLNQYVASGAPIRIIRHETNQGVVAAVNRGIREARGSHVLLASADERMEPNTCDALMAAATRYPESQLVVSSYTQWYPNSDIVVSHGRESELGLWFMRPGEDERLVSAEEFEAILKRSFAFLSINAALFRREALLAAGLYDPALRWHSDWFLIYSIALRHGFVAVNKPLVWFRMDEQSYSGHGMRQPTQQRAVAAAILAKLQNPEFADIRSAMLRAPAAMSPFMRGLLTSFALSPRQYDAFFCILKWWLFEVARGRRPGFMKRMTERLGRPLVPRGPH
jgi:glycosyltransferase involved in cell wall biosynthesis